jgi:hypothetical protein
VKFVKVNALQATIAPRLARLPLRRATLPSLFVVVALILAGCGTPPPLVSNKYLNTRSLIGGGTDPNCAIACFEGIKLGETTFADALSKVRADTVNFSNVQSQDSPPQAAWATKDGEACCQLTGDADTGLVDAILLRVAPVMTVGEVVAKLGEPKYVSVLPQDYSESETALGLVYPEQGNVVWVMPGNAQSSIDASDPVVIVLYLDPKKFPELLDTAILQGWTGYGPYATYKAATPVVTPRITLTPAQ